MSQESNQDVIDDETIIDELFASFEIEVSNEKM